MSGYRRVNYYELCRLCTSSDGNKINIFRDDGRRRQLQTKIQTYLPVQVLEEDSLPKIVCHDCIKKLENYIEFRETVVSAESMLESYFTSLRFSEDFLKEGKVYVKSTEKERSASSPQADPLKLEKSQTVPHDQIIINEPPTQLQHPVVVSNINTSNIQIISGVQARVQQYKCAMQMQSGGVAAAVVEATAETHYSYQQQTSQQLSPQQHPSHAQDRINDHQNQSQSTQPMHAQNQIHNQNQMNQQLQSQRQQTVVTQQSGQRPQLSQQQSRQQQVTQQHPQPQPQYHLTQHMHQFREFEKQRQLQQIDKTGHISQQQQQQHHHHHHHQQQEEEEGEEDVTEEEHHQQNQLQVVHQNNNVLVKDVNTEQSQVILKSEVESHNINSPGENVQNYTTVQATPEVFLSLGFKEATALAVTAQTQRDETKDFRDYIKNSTDASDALTRNSIGQISEFLRIRTCPESSLITVNPQVICQPSRNLICRDCGKTFESTSQLNNHQCPNSPLINEVMDIDVKEEPIQTNGSGGTFSCDICGKPFKRKEHLFQHRKLHTGERPYVCTTCTKAFSRKEHLVRHSVSHTGQKMHECELCGKSFSRKDNLHKHRKTHGVSGPYICETCGKSFVVKHYYLMHLTTHAPTVMDGDNCQDPLPYKCDLCHKAFSVKQYLTTHKLRHRSKNNAHGNNVQQEQQQSQQPQQQQSAQSQAQQIQQAVQNNVTNGISVTSTNDLPATNGQRVDAPVVEMQNIIETNDTQQTQQQHSGFGSNQFHGNGQQFQ